MTLAIPDTPEVSRRLAAFVNSPAFLDLEPSIQMDVLDVLDGTTADEKAHALVRQVIQSEVSEAALAHFPSTQIVHFEPRLHPRDRLGRFTDVLSRMMHRGEEVRLPRGITVRHSGSGYEVRHGDTVTFALHPQSTATIALQELDKAEARSLGEFLELPKAKGPGREHGQRIIDAVDKVLAVPELPKIALRVTRGKDKRGSYHRTKRESPGRVEYVPEAISFSTKEGAFARYGVGSEPLSTLAHEVGHFLDNQAFTPAHGRNRYESVLALLRSRDLETQASVVSDDHARASYGDTTVLREPSPLDEWHAAVEASDAVGALRTEVSFMEMELHKYLLKPQELFARSFMQWLALRSGDEDLLAELRSWQNIPDTATHYVENWKGIKVPVTLTTPRHVKFRQWQDADFESIAAALDKAFEQTGMLRLEHDVGQEHPGMRRKISYEQSLALEKAQRAARAATRRRQAERQEPEPAKPSESPPLSPEEEFAAEVERMRRERERRARWS